MSHDLIFWYGARVAALTAFVVLAGSLLTGMAVRTAYLSAVAKNRVVISLHTFLSWFWVPLVLIHISCLLLDSASRISWIDVVIPFQTALPGATLAVGLGTLGFLVLLFIWVTSVFRSRMSPPLWRWLHRLTYPMFVVFLVHAQLAGSDFSHTSVSVIGWATLGMLAMLALPRAAGGRVATAEPPVSTAG